ncbi:MAG: EAL domain-containing protein [Sulfuricella sp.]|nr:EAL domain-containing protein [Sulfuricella sp.]
MNSALRRCPQTTSGEAALVLAGSVVKAVLHTPAETFGKTLGSEIRNVFGWADACVYLSAKAGRLASRGMPERWHELAAKVEQDGQLGWLPVAGQGDGESVLIGCPIVPNGELVGILGALAPLGCLPTLQAAASLIADTLHDRLRFDERMTALVASEELLMRQQQILDQIHDSVIIMDLGGYITGWNRGAELQFGYTAEEAVGRNILFLYADEEDDAQFFENFLERGGHEMVVKRRKKSGEVFWASLSLSLSHDAEGNPVAIYGYLIDITERLAAEERLRLQAAIFEYSDEGILVTDVGHRIISVNKAFTKISGYDAEDVVGQTPALFKSGLHDKEFYRDMSAAIMENGHWIGELWNRRKDGENYPVWMSISGVHNKDGAITHYFAVFTDLTERKNAEKQIYRLAYYDVLTGLPNRAMLHTLLRQSLIESKRNSTHGAVMFVDLDRFKQINDTLGHSPGDFLLKEVARRLLDCLRNEDIVARIGGDEFVVALVDIAKREHASIVAKKILASLAQPLEVQGHELRITASIGISIYPDDGDDAETLIRNADVAMYRAKQGDGHEGYVFFSPDMNRKALERLNMEGNLRRAIERGELFLHYQPQLDLASGAIVGAEVLLRWNHPAIGMISPGQFIPVAEDTGLIIPIGEWILDTVCARNKAWQQAGLPVVKLAVNISVKQFRPTLAHQVSDILQYHGLAPDLLELEITESMIMKNVEGVIAMMNNFRDLGVAMSLDDFGTGYSSLSYLKRFPIDKLKIDQSFVRGVIHDANDTAITRSIINLAQNLGLRAIAEGVETEAQLNFLKAAGCEEIQGYFYSRPIPETEFVKFLQEKGNLQR